MQDRDEKDSAQDNDWQHHSEDKTIVLTAVHLTVLHIEAIGLHGKYPIIRMGQLQQEFKIAHHN